MAMVEEERLHLIARSSQGLTLLRGPPFETVSNATLEKVSCTGATFSKNGDKLAVIGSNAVVLYDPVTCQEIRSLTLAGAVSAVFSPSGSYLQIFQKPRGAQEKNAGIWDVNTGTPALLFYQKAITKTTWPAFQFSEDETVACRLATNDVQIYDGKDFSKGIVNHLRLTGIQAVQLSTKPASFVATYVPESKGQPAVVRIHDLKQTNENQHVARRSFFKSTSVNMIWNYGSTGLLVIATSEDDKSNQSYYGESRLHYLKSDGSHEGSVPLNKDGPIHDAQWSPTGKEFIVVYGFMPAKATLFDLQCRPLFDFGSGPYNTVRWNTFGTFLCLAGFGNLPGDMVFWDRSTLKQLGSCKAPCSVTCEWSPDGRLLMTATTAPRMQVDNGIKIFKYTGALVEERKIDKLYQADWRPGQYADRPPSPLPIKPHAVKQESSANAAKPAAYRPPHTSASAVARAQLFGEEEKPAKIGGELSKAALKNKKRREKQKQERTDSPMATEDKKVDEAEEAAGAPGGGDDVGKKLRALNKKLRQIEELKSKLSGQTPSEAQQKKLEQEEQLREEIRKLELE